MVPYPKGCRMGSRVALTLLSGLLDGWDRVLHSVIDRAMNWFPRPGRAVGQGPQPIQLTIQGPKGGLSVH